jgi:hypothetical protein
LTPRAPLRKGRNQSDVCNASPYLGYLRSHLKHFFGTSLSAQPLFYSFYVENVLPPYRSRLEEASAPTAVQSFVFEGKKVGDGCSASPALSKARFHFDNLMKATFGNQTGNVECEYIRRSEASRE